MGGGRGRMGLWINWPLAPFCWFNGMLRYLRESERARERESERAREKEKMTERKRLLNTAGVMTV